MNYKFVSLFIVFIELLYIFGVESCSINVGKLRPEYHGVDPKIAPYVQEYKRYAKLQDFEFTKEVTIGFKNINKNNTVAECYFEPGFREIDIDINYWDSMTDISRLNVMLHELSHCYCDRIHDYAEGKEYPDSFEGRQKEKRDWYINHNHHDGYYDSDNCPTSLLYPSVLDDFCTIAHFSDYVKEMFNRCEPY